MREALLLRRLQLPQHLRFSVLRCKDFRKHSGDHAFTAVSSFSSSSSSNASSSSTGDSVSIVRIANGTFYRRQPSIHVNNTESSEPPTVDENPALFPDLTFDIPSRNDDQQHWAVVGPSNAGKTTFLEILRGQHLCFPPTARSFPYLSTDELAKKDPRLRYSGNAIQYVGFDNKRRGLSGLGTYMSARYESRREATDFCVLDYLKGHTQLNADQDLDGHINEENLKQVMTDLKLLELANMPVTNLSNGQSRRARIAKALLDKPEVLLLDEPFMGLDPPTTIHLSNLLHQMAVSSNPRLLLALRPQDPIPDWITHILFLGEDLRITHAGSKEEVTEALAAAVTKSKDSSSSDGKLPRSYHEFGQTLTSHGISSSSSGSSSSSSSSSSDGDGGSDKKKTDNTRQRKLRRRVRKEVEIGEPVIEMDGVVIKYGDKTVLGGGPTIGSDDPETSNSNGLFWQVRQGQRWGIFGANGSGKTTLLSLITSDHPQAYAQPIKTFGRSRLPTAGQPGIPVFELQRRIGHSSPEVHAFFPRSLTVRATLESAFADTPLSRPELTARDDEVISAFLRWFQAELNPSKGADLAQLEEFRRDRGDPTANHRQYASPGKPVYYRERYNEYWYDRHVDMDESVEWADDMPFTSLSFGAQRVALFLRALVARPDIVVLDEAFAGLDDAVRDKCLLFLEAGETKRVRVAGAAETARDADEAGIIVVDRRRRDMKDALFEGLTAKQALLVVSHVREEIPGCVADWIFLPEAVDGKNGQQAPVRLGTVGRNTSLRQDEKLWNSIWNLGF